jgi:predicted aconitase with swiveling domain
MYAFVINPLKSKTSFSFLGVIDCMEGFTTGRRRGVSTVPLLVKSFAVRPSKSLSFTSKVIVQA